jgi:hypothetical protein
MAQRLGLPPRKAPSRPISREGDVFTEDLQPNPVLPHQHIVYDLDSRRPIAGRDVNTIGHLSSNTKIAALALIAAVRGVDYINSREHHQDIKTMMSLSHNDATLVEVAKALNMPVSKLFESSLTPLKVKANGAIDRTHDNDVANKYPAETRKFFEAYRAELAKHQKDLGIRGAAFNDTSGRANKDLRPGTSEASPYHIAHLVDYLYHLDGGKTLKSLSNPNDGPHTTSGYLAGRKEVFFAKTGTLTRDEFNKLPPGSDARTQFKNGVYVLTMGYMDHGKPKMVFMRANSSEERKKLANQFLDDVAGNKPEISRKEKPADRPKPRNAMNV